MTKTTFDYDIIDTQEESGPGEEEHKVGQKRMFTECMKPIDKLLMS